MSGGFKGTSPYHVKPLSALAPYRPHKKSVLRGTISIDKVERIAYYVRIKERNVNYET